MCKTIYSGLSALINGTRGSVPISGWEARYRKPPCHPPIQSSRYTALTSIDSVGVVQQRSRQSLDSSAQLKRRAYGSADVYGAGHPRHAVLRYVMSGGVSQ